MAVLLIGLPLGGTVAAGAKETAQAEGTALTYKTGFITPGERPNITY